MIFIIGHSMHKIETFIAMLKAHGVTRLVTYPSYELELIL